MDAPDPWAPTPTQQARRTLAQQLGLAFDPSMQDWAWENADACRTSEFIAAYAAADRPPAERVELMELILQGLEETGDEAALDAAWARLKPLLKAAAELHRATIDYWSGARGDTLTFALTARARALSEELRREDPGWRSYSYVGPQDIADATRHVPPGDRLDTPDALRQWLHAHHGDFRRDGTLVLTFTVDRAGLLRVADRHSEHVACAGGGPVQAAGELTFTQVGASVEVEAVTNQSTGYCPPAASWPAVARALGAIGLAAPAAYTTAFDFRRCNGCSQIHVLKDGDLVCGVCGAVLPEAWNLDRG